MLVTELAPSQSMGVTFMAILSLNSGKGKNTCAAPGWARGSPGK